MAIGINSFCAICKTTSKEDVKGTAMHPTKLPQEWRLVRAGVSERGNWYHDPDSPAQICVCPNCKVIGE